jgi:5-methylcytosine-specific restriction endonuclease McrA
METMEKKLKGWIISSLRRINNWDIRRANCLKKNRIGKGIYLCNICQETFGGKDIAVDHIEPVVSLSGWTDWNDFMARLFCHENGYQLLCKKCHKAKTQNENSIRRAAARQRDIKGDNIAVPSTNKT